MRRNTRLQGDWSSDVCSSDLPDRAPARGQDVAVLVEHDHGLATLLEQHLAAHRIWIHHSVTTPSHRVSTFRLHDAGVSKVLIIEDEEIIAMGIARHLTVAGFETVGDAHGEPWLTLHRDV